MKTTSGLLGLGAISALVIVCSLGSAAEGPLVGSSTNINTGETINVYKNADGTREVVKTDANGKEISRETHGNEPVSKAKPNTDPKGGSTVNPDNGIKTELILNGDGTRTIILSKDGVELYRQTLKRNEMLSEEGYNLQRVTTSSAYSAPEPVYVERREVVVEERAPQFSVGFGFGFGSRHARRSCEPCPSRRTCR